MAPGLDIRLAPALPQRLAGDRTQNADPRRVPSDTPSPTGLEEKGNGRRRTPNATLLGAGHRGSSWRSDIGSATVSYRATTSTSGAATPQRVGKDVAGLGGLYTRRPRDRDVGQRLHQPLGDEPLRDDVGDQPALAQRRGGARADGRDPHARKHPRIVPRAFYCFCPLALCYRTVWLRFWFISLRLLFSLFLPTFASTSSLRFF